MNRFKKFRMLFFFIMFSFISNMVGFDALLIRSAQAQDLALLPGGMLLPSPNFSLPVLKGIYVDPVKPLEIGFVLDSGALGKVEQEDAEQLIKYFLAVLTIPEEELWVNLSPYEQERVIPEALGVTEAGKELLVQDYFLKQLSASLTYPDSEIGRIYWEKLYKKVHEITGTTDIPLSTFNKVWIVPQKAVVYEVGNGAVIGEAKLKVLMDEDYVASSEQWKADRKSKTTLSAEKHEIHTIISQVAKEVLIPALEKEVNEGKTFASLRQIYHSLILAGWYKDRLRQTAVHQAYADQKKIKGIDSEGPEVTQDIYKKYVTAYKNGVYNFIREDVDRASRQVVPRKYFSGGTSFDGRSKWMSTEEKGAEDPALIVSVGKSPVSLRILLQPLQKLPRTLVMAGILAAGMSMTAPDWAIAQSAAGSVDAGRTPAVEMIRQDVLSRGERLSAADREDMKLLSEAVSLQDVLNLKGRANSVTGRVYRFDDVNLSRNWRYVFRGSTYDWRMELATLAFQERMGLRADGDLGPQTRAALRNLQVAQQPSAPDVFGEVRTQQPSHEKIQSTENIRPDLTVYPDSGPETGADLTTADVSGEQGQVDIAPDLEIDLDLPQEAPSAGAAGSAPPPEPPEPPEDGDSLEPVLPDVIGSVNTTAESATSGGYSLLVDSDFLVDSDGNIINETDVTTGFSLTKGNWTLYGGLDLDASGSIQGEGEYTVLTPSPQFRATYSWDRFGVSDVTGGVYGSDLDSVFLQTNFKAVEAGKFSLAPSATLWWIPRSDANTALALALGTTYQVNDNTSFSLNPLAVAIDGDIVYGGGASVNYKNWSLAYDRPLNELPADVSIMDLTESWEERLGLQVQAGDWTFGGYVYESPAGDRGGMLKSKLLTDFESDEGSTRPERDGLFRDLPIGWILAIDADNLMDSGGNQLSETDVTATATMELPHNFGVSVGLDADIFGPGEDVDIPDPVPQVRLSYGGLERAGISNATLGVNGDQAAFLQTDLSGWQTEGGKFSIVPTGSVWFVPEGEGKWALTTDFSTEWKLTDTISFALTPSTVTADGQIFFGGSASLDLRDWLKFEYVQPFNELPDGFAILDRAETWDFRAGPVVTWRGTDFGLYYVEADLGGEDNRGGMIKIRTSFSGGGSEAEAEIEAPKTVPATVVPAAVTTPKEAPFQLAEPAPAPVSADISPRLYSDVFTFDDLGSLKIFVSMEDMRAISGLSRRKLRALAKDWDSLFEYVRGNPYGPIAPVIETAKVKLNRERVKFPNIDPNRWPELPADSVFDDATREVLNYYLELTAPQKQAEVTPGGVDLDMSDAEVRVIPQSGTIPSSAIPMLNLGEIEGFGFQIIQFGPMGNPVPFFSRLIEESMKFVQKLS